jgi:hypothetical protein
MQSMSAEQVVLHAVPLAQTKLFGQAPVGPAEHVPLPLQFPIAVSCALLQAGIPQLTVETAYRQPPFPSHVPSCPQVAESTAQAPAEEPPATTGLQTPVAQVMQVPEQVVAQQIPEMQLPCVHMLFLLQVDPSDSVAAQVLEGVQYPLGHWVSAEQLVAQPVVAEQLKPLQLIGVPATHVPWPLQVLAGVNPPPPQLAARQMVLLPYFSQAPLPSQWPVFPHDVVVPAAHPPAGSASP